MKCALLAEAICEKRAQLGYAEADVCFVLNHHAIVLQRSRRASFTNAEGLCCTARCQEAGNQRARGDDFVPVDGRSGAQLLSSVFLAHLGRLVLEIHNLPPPPSFLSNIDCMGGVLCCCSEPVNFDGEVDLYHFDLHRAVGKGAFGKVCALHAFIPWFVSLRVQEQVRVVEHKKSKQLYALKYIDKAKCIKQKAVANIIQERRLLEEVRSVLRPILQCFISRRCNTSDRPPIHCQPSIRLSG